MLKQDTLDKQIQKALMENDKEKSSKAKTKNLSPSEITKRLENYYNRRKTELMIRHMYVFDDD